LVIRKGWISFFWCLTMALTFSQHPEWISSCYRPAVCPKIMQVRLKSEWNKIRFKRNIHQWWWLELFLMWFTISPVAQVTEWDCQLLNAKWEISSIVLSCGIWYHVIWWQLPMFQRNTLSLLQGWRVSEASSKWSELFCLLLACLQ
jgi:hypothetical protein